jgi:glycosyltransferase involved in cell wall biosynthesis
MRDSVLVCIPTFQRPKMLRRLLNALAALNTDADVRVLVADNDAENHAGYDLCHAMTDYRWPLSAVIAPERGIAQVRNILIEQALRTDVHFIAMIDDDEWPQSDWIAQFLKCAHETDADVLQGSILFGGMDGIEGHGDIRHATGPVAMLQGAGNLLIRRAVLEDMSAPWFDPAFALSGGEDREFFVRLQRAAKRFAWSDEARAHGDIPATKDNLGWLLRRAYSVGNSDMRVLLKHGLTTGGIIAELCKIGGSCIL